MRTRRLGLRTRVALGTTLIATLLAVALAIVVYVSVRSYLLSQRESVIRREAFANASVVAAVVGDDPSRASSVISSLRSEPGSVAMLRVNGEWRLSSIAVGPESLPPDVLEMLDAGEATTMRFDSGGEQRAPSSRSRSAAATSTTSRSSHWRAWSRRSIVSASS